MTDSEFIAWIVAGGRPTILVEATAFYAGSDKAIYASNTGYTTGAGEAPANTSYVPVLRGGLTIRSDINLDNSPSISWGDIELDNTGGIIDDWLTYVWNGRVLNLYVGDASWPRSDFRQIFTGTMDGIGSSGRDILNIKLRDKMELLNTSVTEALIGGSSNNKDKLRPMLFGECHNIEPVLIDPTTLRYKINDGPIESIIEVRDGGVPVDFTPYLSVGEFTIANSVVETLTVSAQGHKFSGTYHNTVARLIQNIVTTFGTTPLSIGDIDTTNFNTFNTANQQPVGIYLTGKTNVAELISQIGGSIGAQAVFSPAGKLQLHRINLPGVATSNITENEIKQDSFVISEVVEVKAAVTINYCKNWSVQASLNSTIPTEHKDLFAKEWFESRQVDAAVATLYNLAKEVDPVDTLLLTTVDADAEALRRLNLVKTQRYIVTAKTNLACLLTLLGSYVNITHRRFGFSTGKVGQVISVTIDLFNNEIEFSVIT